MCITRYLWFIENLEMPYFYNYICLVKTLYSYITFTFFGFRTANYAYKAIGRLVFILYFSLFIFYNTNYY